MVVLTYISIRKIYAFFFQNVCLDDYMMQITETILFFSSIYSSVLTVT